MASETFEWDEAKRVQNLSKHGIDFRDVPRAFAWPRIEDYDSAHSVEEDRWRVLGYLDGRVIFFVYTERQGRKRLISARPATPDEAMIYIERFWFEERNR